MIPGIYMSQASTLDSPHCRKVYALQDQPSKIATATDKATVHGNNINYTIANLIFLICQVLPPWHRPWLPNLCWHLQSGHISLLDRPLDMATPQCGARTPVPNIGWNMFQNFLFLSMREMGKDMKSQIFRHKPLWIEMHMNDSCRPGLRMG